MDGPHQHHRLRGQHQGARAGRRCRGRGKDLLKPVYKGKIAYDDPTWGGTSYTLVYGLNNLMGGNEKDFKPGLAYLKKLDANVSSYPRESIYNGVLRGEVPIWINADGNGYKMKYVDGGPVEVVIPSEGTFTMPLVMGLVKGAPHKAEAKKYLDWLLTAPAQGEFAKAYFLPILPGATPKEIAAHFLPAGEYKRARALDLAKMAARRGRPEAGLGGRDPGEWGGGKHAHDISPPPLGSAWTGALLALPLLLFLAAGVAWPIAELAARAFTTNGGAAFGEVLAAGRYRASLVNSLGPLLGGGGGLGAALALALLGAGARAVPRPRPAAHRHLPAAHLFGRPGGVPDGGAARPRRRPAQGDRVPHRPRGVRRRRLHVCGIVRSLIYTSKFRGRW